MTPAGHWQPGGRHISVSFTNLGPVRVRVRPHERLRAIDPGHILVVLLGVHGPQDLEGAAQPCVDAHHPARVVELAAVVRRGKYGHESPGRLELVSVLYHLMRPADDVQVVLLQEVADDLVPERVTHAPRVVACADAKARPH